MDRSSRIHLLHPFAFRQFYIIFITQIVLSSLISFLWIIFLLTHPYTQKHRKLDTETRNWKIQFRIMATYSICHWIEIIYFAIINLQGCKNYICKYKEKYFLNHKVLYKYKALLLKLNLVNINPEIIIFILNLLYLKNIFNNFNACKPKPWTTTIIYQLTTNDLANYLQVNSLFLDISPSQRGSCHVLSILSLVCGRLWYLSIVNPIPLLFLPNYTEEMMVKKIHPCDFRKWLWSTYYSRVDKCLLITIGKCNIWGVKKFLPRLQGSLWLHFKSSKTHKFWATLLSPVI